MMVRNEEVFGRAIIETELAGKACQKVLRWFGHVERMEEDQMARRVLMAEVSGGRVHGRPRFGWMDGVTVGRGLERDYGGGYAKDRITRPFLLGPVLFRTALPCMVGYHLERVG